MVSDPITRKLAESSPATKMTSLYRRILGKQFDLLPRALQEFHDRVDGGRGHGEFQVWRGKGRLRNGCASWLGLPVADMRVPVHLEVRIDGQREHWVRHFGDRRMQTVQWSRDGMLIEAAGPMRFGLDLSTDATGLRFKSRRGWFYFLPLPRFLVPKIEANVRVRGEKEWHVEVRVSDPFGKLLLAYEGLLQID